MVEEEYPKNLRELEANFGTDEACRAYLARLRWPRGFVCPRCGLAKAWPVRDRWECGGCGCQTSVTAGTIFQDTRTSLVVWFRAMWWVTTQKNGASALGLQRVLGLKSYETAWTWLHKLRRAMVRPGRDLLTGRVEVDECYIGGLEEGLPGRLNLKKALVVVAAQEDGPGIGRIRMRQIVDASAESLVPFVQDSVAVADGNPPGSGQSQAPRLLSGRVHLPLQPTEIKKPRQALLSPGAAGRCGRASPLRSNRPPDLKKNNGRTTTCWAYLSEADTHLVPLFVPNAPTQGPHPVM